MARMRALTINNFVVTYIHFNRVHSALPSFLCAFQWKQTSRPTHTHTDTNKIPGIRRRLQNKNEKSETKTWIDRTAMRAATTTMESFYIWMNLIWEFRLPETLFRVLRSWNRRRKSRLNVDFDRLKDLRFFSSKIRESPSLSSSSIGLPHRNEQKTWQRRIPNTNEKWRQSIARNRALLPTDHSTVIIAEPPFLWERIANTKFFCIYL